MFKYINVTVFKFLNAKVKQNKRLDMIKTNDLKKIEKNRGAFLNKSYGYKIK